SASVSVSAAAPIQPSTCAGDRAPTIAPLTPGQASVQATATAATVAPCRCAIGRSASASARSRRNPAPVTSGARDRQHPPSTGAGLPFGLQLQQRAPVVSERSAVLGGPVHLVQVDALDGEPAERRLDLAVDAQGIAYAARRRGAVVLVPHETCLGENVGPVVGRDIAQRAGDDLLGVAEAVHRRRIDPVDAALAGVEDGGGRGGVVL